MNEISKTKFADWCRANGLTAVEVAERIGCSKSTVYAYWYGQRLPSRRTMKRMEAVLGVDTRRMFGL